MQTTPDRLLSVPQAVTYLDDAVSATTLRRLIAGGHLRSVRVGARVLIRVSAIEDYLNRADEQ